MEKAELKSLTVVIPLGPRDVPPKTLLNRLKKELPDSELILCPGENRIDVPDIKKVPSKWGRARQLNAGGENATGNWIWFLHADSEFNDETIAALKETIKAGKPGLYYFQLAFSRRGASPAIAINEKGANLRSKWLGLPFGDQGFLLPTDLWNALGRFNEKARFGEDHLLVWAARKSEIPIRGLNASLTTSPRKYERRWLSTTLWNFVATYGQALPEAWDLMLQRHRFRNPRAAMAIFVKTPEISPVKTRLASTTSPEIALQFYENSIAATAAMAKTVEEMGMAVPYWSVAEKEGLENPRWNSFSSIDQGRGDLGDRLYETYHRLLKRHQVVVLIGCDCPHLSAAEVGAAIEQLKKHPFVAGPARDGGFYLFGGKLPIERGTWNGVPYSSKKTLQVLSKRLAPLGGLQLLPVKTDVDTSEDLAQLKQEMTSSTKHFPSGQKKALEAILELLN